MIEVTDPHTNFLENTASGVDGLVYKYPLTILENTTSGVNGERVYKDPHTNFYLENTASGVDERVYY